MSWSNFEESWLDSAWNAGKEAVERGDEISHTASQQHLAEEAHQQGVTDAEHDWVNGTANTLDFGGHDTATPYADVAAQMPGGPEIHLPDTINPWIAGSEVALTPTELDGESRWHEGQQMYDDAYHDAYRAEAAHQFDSQLQERLEPDPTAWQSPSDFLQNGIDSDIPSLSADPSPSYSSDSYSHSSDSYAPSASDSSSSSGSDSASSSSSASSGDP